jgi:hypothetical protein
MNTMKITLALGHSEIIEKGENATASDVKSTSGQYAINLGSEFKKRGIEVQYYYLLEATRTGEGTVIMDAETADYYSKNPPQQCDHFISLEQSGFTCRTPKLLEEVRNTTSGYVSTICDHDKRIGDEDFVFHARLKSGDSDKAIYVGWGADEKLFYPEKNPETFMIYIDHKYYYDKDHDWTEEIIQETCNFFKNFDTSKLPNNKKQVEIAFLGPTGIEVINPDQPPKYSFGKDRSKYTKRVPLDEIAVWYRKMDVFIVTHSETMGQPVLEAAMCGALVVAPINFIQKELLFPLSHIEFTKDIPWDTVFKSLDVKTARERALNFTWSKVAEKILNQFENKRESKLEISLPKIEFKDDYVIISYQPDFNKNLNNLVTWSLSNLKIISDENSEALKKYNFQTSKNLGYHYLGYTIDKNPEKKIYTLSFFIEPINLRFVQLSLYGARQSDNANCIVDLEKVTVASKSEQWRWKSLNSKVLQINENKFWLFLTAESDFTNTLGMQIQFLDPNQNGYYDDREYKAKISGLQLKEGSHPICLNII